MALHEGGCEVANVHRIRDQSGRSESSPAVTVEVTAYSLEVDRQNRAGQETRTRDTMIAVIGQAHFGRLGWTITTPRTEPSRSCTPQRLAVLKMQPTKSRVAVETSTSNARTSMLETIHW